MRLPRSGLPRSARRPATRTSYVALLLAATAVPPRLGAQDSPSGRRPPVSAGDLVRVRGRNLPAVAEPARVVETRGDTLVLRRQNGEDALVPLEWVTDLEVERGRRPRSDGARRGARVGALAVGIPMALLTTYSTVEERRACSRADSDCMIPVTPFVAVGGLALTAVGTLVGAGLGTAVAPRERWTRVDPRVRVGAAPAPGGGGVLAVSYRF